MTIKEMIREWLVAQGMDGLYDAGECACGLDDLMGCETLEIDCEPGVRVPCACGEKCDFHIGPEVGS